MLENEFNNYDVISLQLIVTFNLDNLSLNLTTHTHT